MDTVNISERRSPITLLVCAITAALALFGCTGTKQLAIDNSFPIPIMEKTPVNLGIYLDDTLTQYAHKERIENAGEWEVQIGAAQKQLFDNLAKGLFENHTFVSSNSGEAPLDGVLKPNITDVQFSIPAQTRSNYYEVWIHYEFELFDRAGNPVGEWKLPAYGKASKNNYGSSSNGLEAAALAACRDAMAFFSINFAREPAVQKWLTAGKPLMPAATPKSDTPMDKDESDSASPTSTPDKEGKQV
jgi:hypothetical protein